MPHGSQFRPNGLFLPNLGLQARKRVLVACSAAIAATSIPMSACTPRKAPPVPDTSAKIKNVSTANLLTGQELKESQLFTPNVMAPLVIGDVADAQTRARALSNPNDPANKAGWDAFETALAKAKAIGVTSVSTDIWWGAVEGEADNKFKWEYYDRVARAITRAGLKWVPILSFHQCGGNVGDSCEIPLPSWLWKKYVANGSVKTENDLKFKSEQGNVSGEFVSPWGTVLVIDEYRDFMAAFQKQYAAQAKSIAEINVSMGPAGELRYPSYNSHDANSGYPTRGALQAYSDLAIKSFQDFVFKKHGYLKAVEKAWGFSVTAKQSVSPPRDGDNFFNTKAHVSPYGKDFFEWYSDSLLNHGRMILFAAVQVFNAPNAPFLGIELGGKVPGVHWRMGTDRLAELTAGLIRTNIDWNDPGEGHGYAPLVKMFRDVNFHPSAPRVVLHFTCLEMDNDEGGAAAASRAKTLVQWVGREAARQFVPIKGENALAGTLGSPRAWENMRDALETGGYQGLTILRVTDVVDNPTAQDGLRTLVRSYAPATPASSGR